MLVSLSPTVTPTLGTFRFSFRCDLFLNGFPERQEHKALSGPFVIDYAPDLRSSASQEQQPLGWNLTFFS